jgi:hypothetical protein
LLIIHGDYGPFFLAMGIAIAIEADVDEDAHIKKIGNLTEPFLLEWA